MIDIGLTKIALVGLVALIVIGPEKLPTVARMAGTLFGRAQRYINQVKSEVSREIEIDELRKMQKDVEAAAGDVEKSLSDSMAQTENSVNAAWRDGVDMVEPIPDDPLFVPFKPDSQKIKQKNFRRQKLVRTAAVPSWYKRQHGRRTRVVSAAARVARYRPASGKPGVFFH